ncbi:hypothetical protein LINPERHAP2_LOCUS21226 [Linum perenne]
MGNLGKHSKMTVRIKVLPLIPTTKLAFDLGTFKKQILPAGIRFCSELGVAVVAN